MPKNVIGQADHAAPETRGDKLMASIRKALVAVLGLAATLVAAGVLDDNTEAIVTGVLAVGTALGVYVVPNKPSAPQV